MPTPGSRASVFLSLQTILKRRDRMQFSNSPHRNLLDGMAIAGSALCLIHCLALPLIIAWLPALSDWLSWPESVHLWILLAALPLSFFALWRHALCEGRKVEDVRATKRSYARKLAVNVGKPRQGRN